MRELERRVVLSVLDAKWREHLYEMDYLQSGIHMRGHAQRDPLIEYQREGYELFTAMMDAIKEESVGNLFNLQFEVQQNPIIGEAGPDGEWMGQPVNGSAGRAGGQVQDAVPLATLDGVLSMGAPRSRSRCRAGVHLARAGAAEAAQPAQLQRAER